MAGVDSGDHEINNGSSKGGGGGGTGNVGGCIHHGGHYLNLLLRKQSVRMAVLCGVVAVSCLLLYASLDPFNFLPGFSFSADDDDALVFQGNGRARIEGVLKAAAMEDKTIILTTLNDAWAEPNSIFDLFLESFRIGNGTRKLLRHLVVIALDKKAYARCLAAHPFCYALKTSRADFSSEAKFMSPDYLRMMWRRINFLRIILQMGYSFIFTDTDIMWVRDPFPRFYGDADFQIACDAFNGNPSDVQNQPNGGFAYVKSNNRTIEFYKFWYHSRTNHPQKHDQDVLNIIKFDPFISKSGLRMKFLDTAFFGGFCQPSRNLNVACTMHANCCIGLENKINDLAILLDDWRKYTSLPPSESRSLSWTVPQDCRSSFQRHGAPKKHAQGKH